MKKVILSLALICSVGTANALEFSCEKCEPATGDMAIFIRG